MKPQSFAAGLILFLILQFNAQAEPQRHIVFIPKSSDQVFWEFMRRGVDRALDENPGLELTWRGPSYNDDKQAQIKILDFYAEQTGVDAIVIAPTDKDALVSPVANAVARNIPVIVVDSGVEGSAHSAFIATDNYRAGRLAAEKVIDLLDGSGEVVVLRTVRGSRSTDLRAEGFIDTLHEMAPNINVAADLYGGGSTGKALHSAMELFPELGHFDAVFAVNESSSEGALHALHNLNLLPKVKMVGFDATDYLTEALVSGDIQALVVQDPDAMGFKSIQAAVELLAGEQVAANINVDAVVVDRSNFDSPDIRALLCLDCQ